jgi:MFS superfamily sulfate permease-like transporter
VPTAPGTLEQRVPIAVLIRKYEWAQFAVRDLIAALSVAALLIPESLGYASIAGVDGELGLHAAQLALLP